eukprot:622644-Rhodomonas_salina.2
MESWWEETVGLDGGSGGRGKERRGRAGEERCEREGEDSEGDERGERESREVVVERVEVEVDVWTVDFMMATARDVRDPSPRQPDRTGSDPRSQRRNPSRGNLVKTSLSATGGGLEPSGAHIHPTNLNVAERNLDAGKPQHLQPDSAPGVVEKVVWRRLGPDSASEPDKLGSRNLKAHTTPRTQTPSQTHQRFEVREERGGSGLSVQRRKGEDGRGSGVEMVAGIGVKLRVEAGAGGEQVVERVKRGGAADRSGLLFVRPLPVFLLSASSRCGEIKDTHSESHAVLDRFFSVMVDLSKTLCQGPRKLHDSS